MKAKIYHNPRCSKSRATLALLRERGIDVEIHMQLDGRRRGGRERGHSGGGRQCL